MFNRTLWIAAVVVFLSTTLAHADLAVYLNDLNVSARADLSDFKMQARAHFGIGSADVDLVFGNVADPGDAVICLWLGRQSRYPYDVVLREYRTHRKQGWGALAQSLGIKPGSSAFKALKNGDIGWTPKTAGGKHDKDKHDKHGKDNGKGKKS